MEQTTLSSSQTKEHRRAARMRKIRPVAFVANLAGAEPSLQTVTANVSRSGMLLVTRRDKFPPAGAGILLMPFEVSAGSPDSSAAIRGRIVYTRYSPKARLRFAGLKFEQDLSERSVRMLGLDGAPDPVSDAIAKLDELESRGPQIAPAMERSVGGTVVREFSIDVEDFAPAAPVILPMESGARADLGAARRAMYREAAAYLCEWGEARIRQTLSERHALARAKGLEGLRSVKMDWNKLKQSFPVLAEVELGRVTDAAAGGNSDANVYYNLRLDQPPATMMQALRDLAGHVGRILIQHGLEDAGAGSAWLPSAHERGQVSFTGAMTISDSMRESLIRLESLYAEARHAVQEAGAARELDAQGEILRMWERA